MRYNCPDPIGKIIDWLEKPKKDADGNEIIWHNYEPKTETNDTVLSAKRTNWYSWFALLPVNIEGKCVCLEKVWRQDRTWTIHSHKDGRYCNEQSDYRYYENRPEESGDE